MQPVEDVPDAMLTPREREVVALIAEGLSNAEIAERLELAPDTITGHVGRMLRALGMETRLQVAVWAVDHELRRSPSRVGHARDVGMGGA